MRGCFDREEHIVEKGSDTESVLVQNEAEEDRDADCREYPDDTISKTSCELVSPLPSYEICSASNTLTPVTVPQVTLQ